MKGRTRIRRRAQMEIVGLAFVVILIVVGLIIYLLFQSSGSKKANAREVRERSTFGTTLETAMLETTVPACETSLVLAIQNCAKSSYLKCGSQPVCSATHDAIDEMLDSVLGENYGDTVAGGLSIPYYATLTQDSTIIRDGSDYFEFTSGIRECNANHYHVAAPSQSISINPGTVELTIAFCG